MAWPAIDWSASWFEPYRAAGTAVEGRVADGVPLADALNEALNGQAAGAVRLQGGSLRFVPATQLPPGEAYEAFIARTACVPTRDTLHDFFNGLVWLAFPEWKRRLHELQADAIALSGFGAQRGPLRDALTLFDESGALLAAPDALRLALRQRDWPALFIGHRALWREPTRLTLFGHALLEKLAVAPYKAITAQVWRGGSPHELQAEALAAKPFDPLPVLGVPGWWAANEQPDFYDDAAVFRPPQPASDGRKPSIEK